MKQFEAMAKTVEEAIEQGLQELKASIGDVDIQVIEEGSKGLFGLFGSRMAKVRLTLKETEEDPLGDLIPNRASTADTSVSHTAGAGALHTAHEMAEESKPESRQEKKTETAPEQKSERKPAERKKQNQPAATKPEAVQERKPEQPPREPVEEPERKPKAEVVPMEKPVVTAIPADQLEEDSPAGVAYHFLQDLTRLMGVDVTIEMGQDAEGNVYGNMNGDTLGILIGRRGETLDAVQYLTSLKVNRGREGYTRVTLDTENYRAKREDTLIRLANRMANRALRTGRRVSLEPMNPYERRIIHYALQQTEGVTTHSEGEEPNRHVVITLKK